MAFPPPPGPRPSLVAAHFARVFGTEEDPVNCAFYFKVGCCRHGDACSKKHNQPNLSRTLLLTGMYPNPPEALAIANGEEWDDEMYNRAQNHVELFYEEVVLTLADYGEVEEVVVVDNSIEYMRGNVYVRFYRDEAAERALVGLTGRLYFGKLISASYCPVQDFREARCRAFHETWCSRGGACRFLHIKHIPKAIKRRVIQMMYNEHPEYLQRLTKKNRLKDRSRTRDRDRDRKERDRDRDRDRNRGAYALKDKDAMAIKDRSKSKEPGRDGNVMAIKDASSDAIKDQEASKARVQPARAEPAADEPYDPETEPRAVASRTKEEPKTKGATGSRRAEEDRETPPKVDATDPDGDVASRDTEKDKGKDKEKKKKDKKDKGRSKKSAKANKIVQNDDSEDECEAEAASESEVSAVAVAADEHGKSGSPSRSGSASPSPDSGRAAAAAAATGQAEEGDRSPSPVAEDPYQADAGNSAGGDAAAGGEEPQGTGTKSRRASAPQRSTRESMAGVLDDMEEEVEEHVERKRSKKEKKREKEDDQDDERPKKKKGKHAARNGARNALAEDSYDPEPRSRRRKKSRSSSGKRYSM